MKDFFVSYNSADKSWAEWIAWELEHAGYSVTIQAWDFRPGSNFVLEMQRAATYCARTIAVLSPNYLSALFTQPEWAVAFAQDPTGAKGTLLPVRVRECGLRGLLPQIIYIDLVDADEATARQRLLDGVKHERAKPKTAPMFPRASGERAARTTRFPGTLPSTWNVPLRNPNFTGRETELAQLHDALKANRAAALTALHGLGGIGKTQLAIEYANRHASEYDIVWWMHAENSAALAANFARLAQPLDLREKDAQDQNVVIDAVKNDLRKNSDTRPYLLIFDNATRAEDVHPFLPDGGHVIITSRNTAWRGIANPLSVQKLARADSVAFLLRRISPPLAVANPATVTSPVNGGGSDADKLADALGDLPLALEQAGAYIEACGSSMADYLALFSARRLELLKEFKPLNYPDTVLTTWNLAFDQIASDANATQLLNLCAFFAPDDIPLDLIANMPGRGGVTPPLQPDNYDLNHALAALLRFSLITKNPNGTISVHRLVQAIVRDRLTDAERKTFAESAVTIIDNAFPSGDFQNDPSTWELCARLLPHTLTSTKYATALGIAPEATARQLVRAGMYYKVRAQFAEAKQMYKDAIEIDEKTFGLDHFEVAIGVNNLGDVLQDLGDLNGARQCFERALKIDEATYGKDHPAVAIDVNNLGNVLQNLGDLNGARQCFERALKIWETNLGENHPQVAIGVNNLGSVLHDLNDLNGARQCFERALKIDETTYGKDHPSVARDVNNLGLVLKVLGDLDDARQYYERALKIFENNLDENHPNVATLVNNLGLVLWNPGDFNSARQCFERALKIWKSNLGENHPQVAIGVNNLGLTLYALGDLSGAHECYERALKIFTQILPADHPNIKTVRKNLEILEEEMRRET